MLYVIIYYLYIAIGLLLVPLIKSDYVLNFLQLIPAILLYFKKFKYQN